MSIFTERGAFWWNDEPIPSGSLAPASHVMGQLVVSDEGLSYLELDGHLAYGEKNSPMRFVGPDVMLEGKAIRGIIKDKNQHVLLSGLRRNGNTFSNRGISYEKFLADSCFIGHPPFPAGDTFSQLRSMEIDLAGFEPWLGLQSIDYARNRNSTSIRAKYKKPKSLTRNHVAAV